MISIPEIQTTVEYDKSAKTWQAVNGTVTPTGNGAEGKRLAQLSALAHDWPEMARLINEVTRSNRNDDRVTDLAIRAAEILQAGKVYQGEVESLSRPGLFHQVRFQGIPLGYDCTCEARRYHVIFVSGIGPICKHGLGQHFRYILGLQEQAVPIPFEGEPVVWDNDDNDWIDF